MIPAGIYLHIPFCAVKCMYCDFYSIADREESIPRFIKSLITEIERCNINCSAWKFDTVFIGGGTPSLLGPLHVESILSALQKKYDLSNVKEFTLEANPGEAPKDRLKAFHSLGINRISMGVQSLQPDLLKFLTRIHTQDQVYDTYNHARSAGFDNVNCDLIYSIPGQSWDVWEQDLNQVINMAPDHISAYTLTLEKGTDLFQMVKNGKVSMPKDGQTGDWFLKTHEILDSNGYNTYEISNFAKPGMECQHNLHYWRIHPYLAFGPSAHGFDGIHRWNNTRSLDHYIQQIESGKSPVSKTETLTKINHLNEIIGFGLRMREGIDLDQIPENYKNQFYQNLSRAKQKWNECIIETEMTVSLTGKGMAFCDTITVELML
jgi:oxygen-independent coproporphyrinogen-3 oxidase